MATMVKFYRTSSSTGVDGLITVAEQKINESLAANLPAGAVVRSVQPALYQLNQEYHLVVTVLIDAPDQIPRERLGFKLG
jgi:hypothetical protein